MGEQAMYTVENITVTVLDVAASFFVLQIGFKDIGGNFVNLRRSL